MNSGCQLQIEATARSSVTGVFLVFCFLIPIFASIRSSSKLDRGRSRFLVFFSQFWLVGWLGLAHRLGPLLAAAAASLRRIRPNLPRTGRHRSPWPARADENRFNIDRNGTICWRPNDSIVLDVTVRLKSDHEFWLELHRIVPTNETESVLQQ